MDVTPLTTSAALETRFMRAAMRRLWRQGEGGDVILQAKPGPGYSGPLPPPLVRAHREILMAGSPYLRKRLRLISRQEPYVCIPIQGVEPRALYSVVECMYDAECLVLDGDNIESVLVCAARLEMEALRALCSAFLEAKLAPDTALRIASIAERRGCEALARSAASFMAEHFEEVAQSDGFAALEADVLCSLLQREGVQESSAVKLLDAVLRWARHEWATRREQLGALLQHVDLQRVPLQDLAERARALPEVPPDVATLLCDAASRQILLHASPASARNAPAR